MKKKSLYLAATAAYAATAGPPRAALRTTYTNIDATAGPPQEVRGQVKIGSGFEISGAGGSGIGAGNTVNAGSNSVDISSGSARCSVLLWQPVAGVMYSAERTKATNLGGCSTS